MRAQLMDGIDNYCRALDTARDQIFEESVIDLKTDLEVLEIMLNR